MSTKIYSFDTESEVELKSVGGKGKALIETFRAGFPVPDGFVLSVDFFKSWMDDIKSSTEWSTMIKDSIRTNCDKVKQKASMMIFDENQKNLIEEVLQKFDGRCFFAVRSSSPEEDLEGTSFAGMYETHLGISKSELERYIASAFSSAFDYRVMEYKKQNNIELDNTCIAIVVQRQVDSDVSGVGFSLNPNNNCYDEVVINASFGLGESIVSGIVTPDTYVVDYIKREITEKNIGDKQSELSLDINGGTIEHSTKDPFNQALSDAQIIELSDLIKKCEKYYGKPMDTEWAYKDSKLYLLQSRPITTYLPLFPELVTKPGERKNLYLDLIVMSQGFSESISVLGTDLFGIMLYEIKNRTFATDIKGLAPTLHGREYINVSQLLKVWGEKTGIKFIETYDENIKKIIKDIDLVGEYKADVRNESTRGSKRRMVQMILRMIPTIIRTKFSNYKGVVEEYIEAAEEIKMKTNALNLEWDYSDIVDESMKYLSDIVNKAGIMMAGMSAYSSIKKMFKGKELEYLVTALGMDLDGNPTSEMGHRLFELASMDDLKKTRTSEEFVKNVENRLYSKEFMIKYDEYISKFGSRGFMEIDVASKRAYEDPTLVYEKLANINTEDSQIINVKGKRKEAYEKLLEVAKSEGFERKFAKQAEIYQATFGYREHPKYMVVIIYAKLHDLALELGERFVKAGLLDDKYHIFDLHINEITMAQRDENINLRVARTDNLKPYKKVKHVRDWPLVIDSRGKIFKPRIEPKDGDIIGLPIAPGIVRGKVKILETPYEKPLNAGEILVTRATEPSWTPIFINAAGVIMEIGGPLQHGGIIAREYGIPCVSGLIGIKDMLKDGDMVEVDGNNGIVKILEENDS